MTLQAEAKTMLGLIPARHHLYQLRNHAAQSGSTPTGTIDAVRATPTMTLDPGPSDLELNQLAEPCEIRSSAPLLNFYACSIGERLAGNILSRDQVERCFAHVWAGGYHLPQGVRADNQRG